MTAREQFALVQHALGLAGADDDGIPGPKSRAAFDALCTAALAELHGSAAHLAALGSHPSDESLGTVAAVPIFRRADGTIWWRSGMTVDADGAADCYHPADAPGRDALACAGSRGHWWGIVTDLDHIPGMEGKGRPIIQTALDPAPGFYVSTTALCDDPQFGIRDPRRYVDALSVAYVALPRGFPVKLHFGARVRVTFDARTADAIYADVGGDDHCGEGSIALARALAIPDNPRHGGVGEGVLYEIPA